MKKSIRVCLLFAAVMAVSSTPLLAAPMGTNPHPPFTPIPPSSASSLASVALTFLGF